MSTKKKESLSNMNSFEFQTSYTKLQKPVINFFRSNHVSVLTGDPGTGKSYLAIYYALMMLKDNAINDIIISKPLIEVGSSIGFLPGSEEEKESVYLKSYIGNFKKIIGEGTYKYLLNGKKIKFEAINFSRGDTYENTIVILDEAQGATLHEIITFTTRLHSSSQMIIMGDEYQADIRNSGFTPFIKHIIKDVNGIGHMELGDEFQMRDPMIVELYKNYKKYLAEKNGK